MNRSLHTTCKLTQDISYSGIAKTNNSDIIAIHVVVVIVWGSKCWMIRRRPQTSCAKASAKYPVKVKDCILPWMRIDWGGWCRWRWWWAWEESWAQPQAFISGTTAAAAAPSIAAHLMHIAQMCIYRKTLVRCHGQHCRTTTAANLMHKSAMHLCALENLAVQFYGQHCSTATAHLMRAHLVQCTSLRWYALCLAN